MANTFGLPSPSDFLKPKAAAPAPPAPTNGIPQRLTIPPMPALQAGPPGPAPAARPVGTGAAPMAQPVGPAATGAAPMGAPTFTFNFGGGAMPPAAAPPPAVMGGEIWPDAQAPQTAGGEMWPDLHGGEIWPDATSPQAPPSPGAPPVETPYRPVRQIAYVPRRFEVDSLRPGEGASMPLGDVYRPATGGPLRLKLNEQGKQAFREYRMTRLRKFGKYPMSEDPMAPTPAVDPGMPVFNAFTGKWIE